MLSGSAINRKARATCRALLAGPADCQLQRRYPYAGLPPAPASEGLGPMMANGLESAFAHAS
jgi:hypothetical protein